MGSNLHTVDQKYGTKYVMVISKQRWQCCKCCNPAHGRVNFELIVLKSEMGIVFEKTVLLSDLFENVDVTFNLFLVPQSIQPKYS
jgi:hypothetical protein